MSTLNTNRSTQLVRGESLKAIQLASLLGIRPVTFTSDDTFAGLANPFEVSGCPFGVPLTADLVETQADVASDVNLSRFRNQVAAALIASNAMVTCEPGTTLELPEVPHLSLETVPPVEQQDVENFLDPLVFHWDEEKYIVSEAIRSYVAQFDADH